MAKRLKDFLTTNSILYKYQFGFRQNHSTVLALIDVIDDIYSHVENNMCSIYKKLLIWLMTLFYFGNYIIIV